jgi:sulfite reductase (NADPH) flavoprotein alpha-component
MRRLILNIHLAIGLVAGLFMIVLGVTGSILAFEPQLDRLLHRDTSYIEVGGKSLSLAEIGDAVSRKYPGESIVAYLPSTEANFPTQVVLSRGIVSVNQYTGEILGVCTRGQSILGIVRALHSRLAARDVGHAVVRWTSVVILLSLISGLYLWWPVKRMRISGKWWSARFWYDLHSSIGFFSLLPMLFIAGTGTLLSFEDQASRLIDKMTASRTINKHQATPAPESRTDGALITPDQAVAIARAELPGAVPYRVQMPQYGGFYVVALEYPKNRVVGDHNSISVDPLTGRIAVAHLSSDLTFRERFMAASSAIHTATIWGMPSRIVGALASILLPLQAVSGLLIWLRRKGILHTR